MEERLRKQINIPEYFNKYIDSSVDLNVTNKVCCPFHGETKPSFSYSPERGEWRCFGACKVGGDVINLHKKNYNLATRQDAIKSLCSILGIHYGKVTNLNQLNTIVKVDKENIDLERAYNLCKLHANTAERWNELDYVMSINPVDYLRLVELLLKWGVNYGE